MLGSDKCPCSADLNRCNDDLNCLGSEGVLRLSFGCFVSLRCPASTFKDYFYIFVSQESFQQCTYGRLPCGIVFIASEVRLDSGLCGGG